MNKWKKMLYIYSSCEKSRGLYGLIQDLVNVIRNLISPYFSFFAFFLWAAFSRNRERATKVVDIWVNIMYYSPSYNVILNILTVESKT